MFKTVRDGERVSRFLPIHCKLLTAYYPHASLTRTLAVPPQALLINKRGQSMVVDGPQRVSVFRRSFQRLQRVSADQYQYIKVQKADGDVEHMPG